MPPSTPPSNPATKVQSERDALIARHVRALDALVINDETPPEDSTPPRPSMAVKAAKKTVNFGKYTTIIVGAIVIVRLGVRLWLPEYAEGFDAFVRVVFPLGGGA